MDLMIGPDDFPWLLLAALAAAGWVWLIWAVVTYDRDERDLR